MPTPPSHFDQALSVMTAAVDLAQVGSTPYSDAVEFACRQLVRFNLGESPHSQPAAQIHDLFRERNLPLFECASTYQSLIARAEQAGKPTKRKKQGAYYTPLPLVDHIASRSVLKSLDEHEGELQTFRICDPAVGVGAFLFRSLHLIAERIDPKKDQRTIDTVVQHCLFGVDIDPVAAMLCRAVLACETSAPKQAFEHLASRIKVGNSIVGATPELIEAGIPPGAFVVKPGDDKHAVSHYKKRNTRERRASTAGHPHLDDPDPRLSADAWCAAFVWRMHKADEAGDWDALTQKHLDTIRTDPSKLPGWMRREIGRLAQEHGFFHWHLEFPGVITPPSG